MKKYLSFGGGVNSVAMLLLLLDQGIEFESIFVDHGTDWPETYEYFDMLQGWLKKHGHNQITVLKPSAAGHDNLYDYCVEKRIVPSTFLRWCTEKFKIRIVNKYIEKPCFQLLGIDAGEAHRAKLNYVKGIENRFPLIEAEMNREDCKSYIRQHGLPVPIKSGCYICPFQGAYQWRELRMIHPNLFCNAEKLEKLNMKLREENGKKPLFLSPKGISLRRMVDEDQMVLFEQDEYPPCQCGL